MKRTFQGTAALLVMCATVPVLAADYPDLRPAYPDSWATSEDDPLRFESGIRYWYSIGGQEHSIGTFSETMETKTSSGEVFVRIEDQSTQTFVEAVGGYGIAHSGSYSTNGGVNLELPAARLGYVGADFGWLPWGTEAGGLGFVAGYQYTNDSPDTGRANFTTADSSADVSFSPATGAWGLPGDSQVNDFTVHALKLGFAGKIDAGQFDVIGEAAATPYANITGTYGAFAMPGQTPTFRQASAATVSGYGYGASGKLMFGFHPTENLTVRIGGRASYLQGQYNATFDSATIVPPVSNGAVPPVYSAPILSKQSYVIDNNPFKMFRYGGLLEVAGRF